MQHRTITALMGLALVGLLAPAAAADGFGFSFGKKSKSRGFSFHYSSGSFYAPGFHVPSAPRAWVPAHYETRHERVFVAGRTETVWVEPRFEVRMDSCGRPFKHWISSGHHQVIHHPGHYETRPVNVWVPGHWQVRACN